MPCFIVTFPLKSYRSRVCIRIHAKMSCIHLFIFVCLMQLYRLHSVAHARVNDVKKHVETTKYKENVQKPSLVTNTCLSSFKRIAEDQVARAEVIL